MTAGNENHTADGVQKDEYVKAADHNGYDLSDIKLITSNHDEPSIRPNTGEHDHVVTKEMVDKI